MKKLLKTLMIFSLLASFSVAMGTLEGGAPSITIKENKVSQYGDGRDNKDDPGIGYQY
ncbi:hypothetical protein [Bacillus sp. LL01]|uniref:hypothetical protein n=1 Tax=Bacillus sp. LL01 TaxID=1665556 RepID=UPI000B21186E|nr:hypothetical protein [Bacillus sp. LL01]